MRRARARGLTPRPYGRRVPPRASPRHWTRLALTDNRAAQAKESQGASGRPKASHARMRAHLAIAAEPARCRDVRVGVVLCTRTDRKRARKNVTEAAGRRHKLLDSSGTESKSRRIGLHRARPGTELRHIHRCTRRTGSWRARNYDETTAVFTRGRRQVRVPSVVVNRNVGGVAGPPHDTFAHLHQAL